MSGFLLLVGCLAVVTLIAIPSFARANATLTAASQTTSLTREIVAPIYVTYTTISGEIAADPNSKMFLKIDSQSCGNLVVHARKAGGTQQGVTTMRKAGGEQEEFTAPATSDGKGGCKYSLKVPGGPGTWSLGVADLFLSPTSDSLGTSNNKHKGDLQYIKWEQQYQQKQDKTNLFLKTYSSEWTWIKGGANDLAIKGESKELKIDGLSAQASLPLYVSWGGGVGG